MLWRLTMSEAKLLQSIKNLKEFYDKGVNISKYLRETLNSENTPEIIEMAYDLQAGTYCEYYKEKPEIRANYEKISIELAERIKHYVIEPSSILEAGIGEGQALGELLGRISNSVKSYGFDISWSRVAYAREWLEGKGYKNVNLFTGDMLNIPCADNAFDIVYTNQAVEPNRGNEESIIKELYRVTKKYLIMLEPVYELAGKEAQERMNEHGYVRGLEGIIKGLGYKIKEYRQLSYSINPLNPIGIIVVEKNNVNDSKYHLACPQFKTQLEKIDGEYYSCEAMKVYPIINGIPCLRIENGIVASKYAHFTKEKPLERHGT